jgi:hypothetical protein
MAGKQFFPFMEMVVQPSLATVQPSLTSCETASYGLWKWLASSSPIYGNGCATQSYDCATQSYDCATQSYSLWNCVLRLMEMVSKQFSPFMELLVQLCLTACATASYSLWKWLASSSPIYGNGFKSGTSENQRLHKKLGNSENRVTYRLR